MPYAAERGEMTLSVAGDIMPSRRLALFTEPEFLALRELFSSADAGFANLETAVLRYGEGSPSLRTGTYMVTEPELLDDIIWFGVNMVSCANSHSLNFGVEGLLLQLKYLDAVRLAHAGTGKNLREASSPAYRDTPKGRIGLVAATAHLPDNRALHQRVDFPGRPGVSALGWRTDFIVNREAFDALRHTAKSLGMLGERARLAESGYRTLAELGTMSDDRLNFRGDSYVLGDNFDIRTYCDETDLAEILRQVKEARRQADYVIASLHSQDTVGRAWLDAKPGSFIEEQPDFVTEFAHAAIDVGADVVAIHGPHYLMGVEIYRGQPIFYSLGNLILENESLKHIPSLPYDRFSLPSLSTPTDFFEARTAQGTRGMPASSKNWEAVVAVCRFAGKGRCDVELYPAELGFGRPRSQRGRPLLATGDAAIGILGRISALSARYGTNIEYLDGHGLIRIDEVRRSSLGSACGQRP